MNKKRAITAVTLCLLLLTAGLGFRLLRVSEQSVLTVTAGFCSQNGSGSTLKKLVLPHREAEIGYGHWPEFRAVRFDGSVLRTGLDYGPVEIRGAIPAADIRAAWPNAPIDGDWPFSIAFYNTSTGRAFHMYLDISVDTGTAEARADLYIFEDRTSSPVTARWTGRPGEPVSVCPDGMEI